jgi:hypothetical protein
MSWAHDGRTMNDDCPKITVVDDVMVKLSRKKTPLELTLMTSRMFILARDRLEAHLRELHPEWTDLQIHKELLWRIHGSA